jgi:hypothetical protein
MLHACFTPIALCFVYTSWRFYAFFGTNLLTRCHNASSCFLVFFYSRLLLKEIFSEFDETKAKVPILLTHLRGPKGRRSRGMRWPHLVVAQPTPWPCYPMVWAPRASTDLALLPIYSHPRGTKFPKPPSPWTLVWEGSEALPGTLPDRGIITGGLLHHHACLRSDAWLVHLWTTGP